MKISWKTGGRERIFWFMAFLLGFFLGIGLLCLFSKELITESGFLDASYLGRLRCLEPDRNGLFLYCLRQRLGTAAFLVLLSAAGAAGIGIGLFLVWCGLSVGAVLTAFSVNFGIRGMICFLACMLPQQLLLIPGYFLLFCWCSRKMDRKLILVPLTVVIMGCFLEGYVNPSILKVILKVFF